MKYANHQNVKALFTFSEKFFVDATEAPSRDFGALGKNAHPDLTADRANAEQEPKFKTNYATKRNISTSSDSLNQPRSGALSAACWATTSSWGSG
jgi:hypothetical protein